jgi:hypothetical protein
MAETERSGGTEPKEPDWAKYRAERIAEMIELGFSDEAAAREARLAEERFRARFAWGVALMDRWREATEAVDAAWARRFEEHPELQSWTDEALDALPDPPEQAALDSVYAEVEGFMEHGRLPRAVHFHAV